MKNIIRLSQNIRETLEKNNEKLDIMGFPFFSSFPTNCCQGTSLLLGLKVKKHFPKSHINIVLGSTRKAEERQYHCWVEIDNKTYDLTIDQFVHWMDKKYNCPDNPIYAANRHPLTKYFFYKKRFSPIEAFTIFCSKHANLEDVIKVHKFLIKKLKDFDWN